MYGQESDLELAGYCEPSTQQQHTTHYYIVVYRVVVYSIGRCRHSIHIGVYSSGM
jgi:hypothetical protein